MLEEPSEVQYEFASVCAWRGSAFHEGASHPSRFPKLAHNRMSIDSNFLPTLIVFQVSCVNNTTRGSGPGDFGLKNKSQRN